MTSNEPNFVLLYVVYCCQSLNKCGKYFVFSSKVCLYLTSCGSEGSFIVDRYSRQ